MRMHFPHELSSEYTAGRKELHSFLLFLRKLCVREHTQVLNSALSHNNIQLFIKDLPCIHKGTVLQITSHVI